MKVSDKIDTFPVDIDKTLIIWIDQDDKRWPMALVLDYYGEEIRAIPHTENIRILRSSVARGRDVIVWSGNGKKWAAEVLTKLGLDHLDVEVKDKPIGYLDDLDCQAWMGPRIYLPFEGK